MVLPAPVSPVTTVRPGPRSSVASSIEPSPRMRTSVSRPGAGRAGGAGRSAVLARTATAHLLLVLQHAVAGEHIASVAADEVAQEHVAAGEQLVAGPGVPRFAEPADGEPELGDQPVAE